MLSFSSNRIQNDQIRTEGVAAFYRNLNSEKLKFGLCYRVALYA